MFATWKKYKVVRNGEMPNIRKIWKIVFATLLDQWLDPVAIPSPFLGSTQISNISCNFLPAGEERVRPDHVRGQPDHRRGGHGRRQERARQHRGAVRRRDALDANKYGFTIQPKTHRIRIMAALSLSTDRKLNVKRSQFSMSEVPKDYVHVC